MISNSTDKSLKLVQYWSRIRSYMYLMFDASRACTDVQIRLLMEMSIPVLFANECFCIWCNYKTERVPAQGLQMEISEQLKFSFENIGS